MRRLVRLLAPSIAVTVVAGLGLTGVASAAPAASTSLSQASSTTATTTASTSATSAASARKAPGTKNKKAKKRGKKPYRVQPGPIFNNPLGGPKDKYRITDAIQTAIQNTPKKGVIRIMSWNVMSVGGVNALLAAQRRGVQVRVIMDSINLIDVPNPTFRRLQAGLRAGNKGVPRDRKSKAMVCQKSCRGDRGQAHAKYYLFSKVGKSKNVLLAGSANLTTAAGTNQWNDLYRFPDNEALFNFVGGVFEQAWADTPVPDAFVQYMEPKLLFFFSPYYGSTFSVDPIQGLLDSVKCTGATGGAGNARGRTIIRVAPDVMRNPRGLRAATRLKALWDQGCDVRIGYTVLGFDSFRVLKGTGGRGPVPMRHLVQDLNGDGDFDNYFHLKTITINGVVGDNPTAYYTTTGSANLSGGSSLSDENVAIIQKKGVTRKYQKFIDIWFNRFSNFRTRNLGIG